MTRQKSIIIFLIILLFGILFFARVSLAATYYVDGSCGSSGNGTTATCGASGPWKTLAEANTNVTSGTHTINVAAGTYNENVTETHSGTDSSHFLHWKANGTVQINGYFQIDGSYVKLEGFRLTHTVSGSDWNGTIHVTGNYNTILNNTLINTQRIGIMTAAGSDHNTLSGNTIQTCWMDGIALNGTNHTVSGNDISDVRCHMGLNSWNDANGIEWNGSGHVINGNYIHNITFAANPGYTPHIDGMSTDWGAGDNINPSTNILIEKNHIDLLDEGLSASTNYNGLMLTWIDGITIRNNIIRSYVGMNLDGIHPVDNVVIVNNAFLNDLTLNTAYWPAGIGFSSNNNNVTLENNIFYNHYYKGWDDTGATGTVIIDYNCIYRSSGSYTEVHKIHDVWAQDPLFINAASDWHLQSSSPCKDAGVTIASVTDDYAGTSRPKGAGYDIGAYEYVQAGDTQAPSVPTNLAATAISSSQINLSWTASTDNVGVTGYKIFRCTGLSCTLSTQLTTTTNTSYSNTGLSASTVYTYAVSAYDAAGKESTKSASVSTSTPAIPDTTPPAAPTGVTVI